MCLRRRKMEKLEATESRIKGSSHSTGNKWCQKRSILVLHTNDITVGGGATTSVNLILRITFHSQSVWFLIFMLQYLKHARLKFETREWNVQHVSVSHSTPAAAAVMSCAMFLIHHLPSRLSKYKNLTSSSSLRTAVCCLRLSPCWQTL